MIKSCASITVISLFQHLSEILISVLLLQLRPLIVLLCIMELDPKAEGIFFKLFTCTLSPLDTLGYKIAILVDKDTP